MGERWKREREIGYGLKGWCFIYLFILNQKFINKLKEKEKGKSKDKTVILSIFLKKIGPNLQKKNFLDLWC